MIDNMAFKQSYEEREIDKIRWIYGENNLADAMTKTLPNLTLKSIISTNQTTIGLKR